MGVGTTFTFTLPYSTQETPKEVDSEMKTVLYKEEVPQSGNGISANEGTGKEKIHMTKQVCILIAEDTDSNYDLLNAILGKQYRLVRANDGMEAVLLYDEVKPDSDGYQNAESGWTGGYQDYSRTVCYGPYYRSECFCL